MPVVSSLSGASLEDFKTSHRASVVGFFSRKNEAEIYEFSKAASLVNLDDVFFGSSDSLDDLQKYKVTPPAIVIFKRNDPSVTFKATFTSAEIVDFVNNNHLGLVEDLDITNMQTYMERNEPIAYFFFDNENQKTTFRPILTSLASESVGKMSFVFIDALKFGRHAESLYLQQKWPAFVIARRNTRWPLSQDTPLTESAIKNHVYQQLNGKLKPKIKSEPIPETNNGSVTVVVGNSFRDIVLDPSKNVFVNFYAPWCIYCQRLEPVWEALGRANLNPEDNIVIAKMDATANDIPPELDYVINGFPTITLFTAGSNEIKEKHTGRRSLDGIFSIISELLAFLNENIDKGVGPRALDEL